jgi:hypothetical protein
LIRRIPPNVLGDAHAAKMRAAHAAKVCRFRAFLWQSLIVELAGSLGIEREVKLILPAELKAGF